MSDLVLETFDHATRKLADEIATMIIEKQSDYGPDNIMKCPVGPEQGILVRMWDKMARLKNLLASGAEAKNEPLDDTYMDICGYAMIALLVRRGQFTLRLEK